MPRTPPKDFPPDWPATQESPLFRPLSRLALALTCRYRREGVEHYPDPPFILVANHLSYFDIPAMILAAPPGIVGLAARKYKGTWMAPLFNLGGLIWVTQFSADRAALRAAQQVLEGGVHLGIAPEGTRSRTGGLGPGADGTAFLATRTGVPLVPAGIMGTEKILKHPRPQVVVRVGKPFRLPEGRAKGQELSAYTERIMCAIAAMMPESYHGVYAGNPLIEEMARIVR